VQKRALGPVALFHSVIVLVAISKLTEWEPSQSGAVGRWKLSGG
jgi:hypothetical protein